jgi:alpha-beta hydrolase superfamily lysophospholipase
MNKHLDLYNTHGIESVPIFSSVKELTTPTIAEARGAAIAANILENDGPIVMHAVSGSFWTALYTLEALPRDWRERNVRALVFDSCPPKSDALAFGGWAAFALRRPWLKPWIAPLFEPYRWLCGINEAWEAENARRMDPRDERCVLPEGASVLVFHGTRDPVLDNAYVHAFADSITAARARGASEEDVGVSHVVLERARHAMAVVDEPETYKKAHVDALLRAVPALAGPPPPRAALKVGQENSAGGARLGRSLSLSL